MEFFIREAKRQDCALILEFIKELAIYEKLEDEVVATVDVLEESMFDKKSAQALIAFEGNHAVGFALYFYNFSTFLGKAGLYLEDLYIREPYRKKGYGKKLFKALANIAIDRGCERLDWACLNWNQSSIDFYLSLNARPVSEWTTYRLEGRTLRNFALD